MSVHAEWTERVIALLLERGPRVLSLDEIGEAIGSDWATAAQIEQLFVSLEARGATIGGEANGSLAPWLGQVLRAARELRAQGSPASPAAIAERTALSPREVRVALLYGEVLSRGRRIGT